MRNTDNATLIDVLHNHANSTNNTIGLQCWDTTSRDYLPLSYQRLSRRAFGFGKQIAESSGGTHNRVVMIACHSPYATLLAFYGAISVGAIPMIFPMPLSLGSHQALTERIRHWGFGFEEPALLVLEEGVVEKFHDDIPSEIDVLKVSNKPDEAIEELSSQAIAYAPEPNDIGFFQTTSSSTGDHKAVSISHANIIANVSGIKRAQKMDDDERMATWLPLFHDMGLVGTVLFSFCNNFELLIMTPTQFIKRPALWLKGMDEHKCTIATAPNFGFDYCARLVSDKDTANLDLSHVKHLFIGAEPIRVSTVNAFVNKFQQCGISFQTIRPAYGLAESTIITSMTDPQETSNFVCVDADSIAIGERIQILDEMRFDDPKMASYDSTAHIAVCSGGKAIEGMLIEILDQAGSVIPEQGVVGEISITGSSVAMGYVTDSEQEESDRVLSLFGEGRLPTGDLGMIYKDELYVLERLKNIIIRNGENYLVSALEEQLSELLNISHEHVVVFDSNIHDPQSDIIALVERHGPLEDAQIDQLLVRMPKEAFPIDKIQFSKAREISRTTSGKKRHFYCRKLHQRAEINFQQEISVSPQRIRQAQLNIDS